MIKKALNPCKCGSTRIKETGHWSRYGYTCEDCGHFSTEKRNDPDARQEWNRENEIKLVEQGNSTEFIQCGSCEGDGRNALDGSSGCPGCNGLGKRERALPCPFCNNSEITITFSGRDSNIFLTCKKCEANGPKFSFEPTTPMDFTNPNNILTQVFKKQALELEALKAWNKRGK
jgi:transcription elongation factor Elf1